MQQYIAIKEDNSDLLKFVPLSSLNISSTFKKLETNVKFSAGDITILNGKLIRAKNDNAGLTTINNIDNFVSIIDTFDTILSDNELHDIIGSIALEYNSELKNNEQSIAKAFEQISNYAIKLEDSLYKVDMLKLQEAAQQSTYLDIYNSRKFTCIQYSSINLNDFEELYDFTADVEFEIDGIRSTDSKISMNALTTKQRTQLKSDNEYYEVHRLHEHYKTSFILNANEFMFIKYNYAANNSVESKTSISTAGISLHSADKLIERKLTLSSSSIAMYKYDATTNTSSTFNICFDDAKGILAMPKLSSDKETIATSIYVNNNVIYANDAGLIDLSKIIYTYTKHSNIYDYAKLDLCYDDTKESVDVADIERRLLSKRTTMKRIDDSSFTKLISTSQITGLVDTNDSIYKSSINKDMLLQCEHLYAKTDTIVTYECIDNKHKFVFAYPNIAHHIQLIDKTNTIISDYITYPDANNEIELDFELINNEHIVVAITCLQSAQKQYIELTSTSTNVDFEIVETFAHLRVDKVLDNSLSAGSRIIVTTMSDEVIVEELVESTKSFYVDKELLENIQFVKVHASTKDNTIFKEFKLIHNLTNT